MGEYLIPGAKSLMEAATFANDRPTAVYTLTEGGVLVTDPTISDAEVEALFAGFTPSGADDLQYVVPIPVAVRTHLQHLRDYVAKDAATITNAETVHVVKDLIRAVHYLNNRFESEG